MNDLFRDILIILISVIGGLILSFFSAALIRRIINARKYAKLDIHRDCYREKITKALQSGTLANSIDELRSHPDSLRWQAVEEILFDLIAYHKYRKDIRQVFLRLGYKKFYEDKLKSRQRIVKATAIDKLGKMLSACTTDVLINILRHEHDPELLTVTVRGLSRSGHRDGLIAILERMPELYERGLVAQRTVETALIRFGSDATLLLVEYGKKFDSPKVTASLLEVLSHITPTPAALTFALQHLNAPNPEVRARALKVIGRRGVSPTIVHPELVLPLLQDRVWFVKLQAAKAVGNLRYDGAMDMLGFLLLDQNWQVRNAAARALAKMDNASLDIFLNILNCQDRYAKESICEEMERTHFSHRLIENLTSPDPQIRRKSFAILRIMYSLTFSTPLYRYLDHGRNGPIKYEIALMMHQAALARAASMNRIGWGTGS